MQRAAASRLVLNGNASSGMQTYRAPQPESQFPGGIYRRRRDWSCRGEKQCHQVENNPMKGERQ